MVTPMKAARAAKARVTPEKAKAKGKASKSSPTKLAYSRAYHACLQDLKVKKPKWSEAAWKEKAREAGRDAVRLV